MPTLSPPIHSLARSIYDLYQRRELGRTRPYLGGSVLGEPCARKLWLGFRWVGRESFDGRMLRLFDTGHREEIRVLDDLRAIGVQVWDRQPDGQQFAVSAFGGHLRGHLDAVVMGLPESPKTPHLCDVKTISTKKLVELRKHGFQKTYPKYYGQGQFYMGMMSLEKAVFIFVCKDTDEIQVERFDFDRPAFDLLLERAERIVFGAEPPVRISDDPASFACKFCHLHAHCHGTEAPAENCRSCAHSTPKKDGTWKCDKLRSTLSEDSQRLGCPHHRVIPILLEKWAEPVDAVDDAVVYRNKLTGHEFKNGLRPEGYASGELAACKDKRAIGAPELKAFRDEFDGRVVV